MHACDGLEVDDIWFLSSPIQVRCHPFFIGAIVVIGVKVTFSRVFIPGDKSSRSREFRELTSVQRGFFFRINVFFVRVVIGEPIFSCSTKLGTEIGRVCCRGFKLTVGVFVALIFDFRLRIRLIRIAKGSGKPGTFRSGRSAHGIGQTVERNVQSSYVLRYLVPVCGL